ncbi:hypothetical protein ABPG74_008355 [Tetrahymena malaccensis]
MYIAQLAEIHALIYHRKKINKHRDEIVFYFLLLIIMSIPLHIISLIWVLKIQFTLLNIGFVSVHLLMQSIQIVFVVIFVFLQPVDIQKKVQSFKELWPYLYQLIYEYYHFFTFFWSLVLIWDYYNLNYYTIAVYTLLFTIQIKFIWARLKNNSSIIPILPFLFLIIVLRIFHTVIDYRNQIPDNNLSSAGIIGYKVQNSIIIFDLLIKFYLLLALFIVTQTSKHDQYLYSFQITILIMLTISFLILLQQAISQVILKYYFKREVIEFDSVKQFVYPTNINLKDEKIKYLYVYDKRPNSYGANIIKALLIEYPGKIIKGHHFEKIKLQNSNYYTIESQVEVKTKELIDLLQNKTAQPEIRKVKLYLENKQNLIELYKLWIDNYINIRLQTNYDNQLELFSLIQIDFQSQIQQAIAFQKYMQFYMIMNPNQVYYDLYD